MFETIIWKIKCKCYQTKKYNEIRFNWEDYQILHFHLESNSLSFRTFLQLPTITDSANTINFDFTGFDWALCCCTASRTSLLLSKVLVWLSLIVKVTLLDFFHFLGSDSVFSRPISISSSCCSSTAMKLAIRVSVCK